MCAVKTIDQSKYPTDCLGHLVAKGQLSKDNSLKDADVWFEDECDQTCDLCPWNEDCPVCIAEA